MRRCRRSGKCAPCGRFLRCASSWSIGPAAARGGRGGRGGWPCRRATPCCGPRGLTWASRPLALRVTAAGRLAAAARADRRKRQRLDAILVERFLGVRRVRGLPCEWRGPCGTAPRATIRRAVCNGPLCRRFRRAQRLGCRRRPRGGHGPGEFGRATRRATCSTWGARCRRNLIDHE